MLRSREFTGQDLRLFIDWAAESPEWEAYETDASAIEEYMRRYDMYRGSWLVWEQHGEPAAITFSVEWAPSNEKAWIGTVIVNPAKRQTGIAKAVISSLAGHFKEKGHKVLFAGVPEKRHDWVLFLGAAGFEQFKLEEEHMIMLRPLQ
ncbi:GNAT family N-acetyltransferase [Bacillus mangrovi]|uniref:GNAT family N-acetyltransferase n=1 Tax=Metabacillus mangrovi TaxID=1491830 RepID=A0A7X2S2P0_9BACI|nr:GNAT family N-acetyltransferase [Metabacillus mangrovi]MTH52577.1 GNAT family N-acetyltransferase [Metabacillus mangrovi]